MLCRFYRDLKTTFLAETTLPAHKLPFGSTHFIGLALAERLAGAPGLLLISVLIGICVPMFNMAAVWPMARHSQMGFAG